MAGGKNQHKPRPPDEDIKEHLQNYYELGLTDIMVTEALKQHYDINEYGLSVFTVRRLRKKWNILSTRQQNHTQESIYDEVFEIRKRFPTRGAEGIRKALRIDYGIRVPRPVVTGLLKTVEHEEVIHRRRRGFRRRHFWAAGVNDVWPQDQHDKWGRFGLWMHAGLEAFSGEINWLKIWWTNRNPRLIAKYYLDTCRRIGGVPIITQSDPGTENYGVANTHTMIRHRLDPSLSNTLQHRFMPGHNNILSEVKWSVFRRDFVPGFEDILQQGVDNGWYDINDISEKLLFRWIAIPWLQTEIDKWVNFKNKTAPRAVRHKILPHGIPMLIRTSPSLFNAVDFKIPVNSDLLDEMEALYAPPDHSVFELVPPPFHEHISQLYIAIGQPEVNTETFWDIYLRLLRQLREGHDEQLTDVLTLHQETLNQESNEMPLLPGLEAFRLGQPLRPGRYGSYMGGLDESSLASAVEKLGVESAHFTEEENDDSDDDDGDDE